MFHNVLGFRLGKKSGALLFGNAKKIAYSLKEV
jgi:hypothetical protein